MPSLLHMLVELLGKKRTLKYKKFLCKLWGWGFRFHSSSSKPKYTAVIHCHRHQKGSSQITPGSNWTHWEAKTAALVPITEMALTPTLAPSTNILWYSTSKETWARDQGGTKGTDECNCAVVWTFFGIEHSLPFFGTGMKTDLFESCGQCWVFQICWHPTPVLSPGKSHGQRSLVGCSPWGH